MTTDEKKLTPVAQQVVPALREKQRIERRSRPLTWMILASAAVIAAALVYLGAHAAATDEVTSELQSQGRTRDQQITDIQGQLKGVCRQVTDPAKLTPAERDGCYRAENSIPPVPVTVTTQAPGGSGLSAGDVQSMITAALAQVPRPLTVEQVAAVAQQVFATNAPALTPTPEKIGDAVASFCAGDACRGAAGKNGENGKNGADAPPVTAAQIQEQVAAYCAVPENHNCTGPAGPQGVSVVGFDDPGPQRHAVYVPGVTQDSDPCIIVAHLIDPDTGRTSSQDVNVPVSFCYVGPPPG